METVLGIKKILFIFGTRPEAIKMAPVILAAKKDKNFDVKVAITGQHRQMLDQILNFFDIKADYDFNIMRENQTLNDIAKMVIEGLDQVLLKEKFDCVMVHGDTTTAMSSSIAAFHHKIPIAHIEAGLRTYNMMSPWPEEMNRRLISVLAHWHFSPTAESQKNLLAEKVKGAQIFVTGNTVIDSLLRAVDMIEKDSSLKAELEKKFAFLKPTKKMILVTGHRRENFGENFVEICKGLSHLARDHDVQIVYPVHLNPNVKGPVEKVLSGIDNIFLIEPQDYVPFVFLMMKSHIIITDSGGVQEEAPSLGKPVLVMRESTERPEAVEAGTVLLVGPNADRIYKEATTLLQDPNFYEKMKNSKNPYGDGKASARILEAIKNGLEAIA